MIKIIFGLVFGIFLLYGAGDGESFSIDTVSIKIYDNKNNKIVAKPTNIYGNNMNLFLAVHVSQSAEGMHIYRLIVNGYGRGRENEAEGLVEDYSVNSSANVLFYNKGSKYIPFILEYPCTDKSTLTIELFDKQGNKVSKKIDNNLSGCYLN